MKSAFEVCMKSGGIERVTQEQEVWEKERREAETALTNAIGYGEENDPRRAMQEAYYAIFFALRAPLLKMGFRPKSPSCLKHAVEELLVKAGKLDRDLMIGLEMALEMRVQLGEHFTGIFYLHEDSQELVRFADHVVTATARLV
ncbi:MAG: HEPN domain-containing protein [Methanomicrobiales archaeon]|nr:HEPN domain-containing protein [Methanomicrobiales archaeon]